MKGHKCPLCGSYDGDPKLEELRKMQNIWIKKGAHTGFEEGMRTSEEFIRGSLIKINNVDTFPARPSLPPHFRALESALSNGIPFQAWGHVEILVRNKTANYKGQVEMYKLKLRRKNIKDFLVILGFLSIWAFGVFGVFSLIYFI